MISQDGWGGEEEEEEEEPGKKEELVNTFVPLSFSSPPPSHTHRAQIQRGKSRDVSRTVFL